MVSDASSTQLVSVTFDGNGFNNWKRSRMLILSAKNKIGFVDGTVSIPEENTSEYKYRSRCNDLVISWIIFNLDENIARSVLFLPTARIHVGDGLDRSFVGDVSSFFKGEAAQRNQVDHLLLTRIEKATLGQGISCYCFSAMKMKPSLGGCRKITDGRVGFLLHIINFQVSRSLDGMASNHATVTWTEEQ